MKTTIALLVLFFLVLGGGYLFANRSQPTTAPISEAPSQASSTTTQPDTAAVPPVRTAPPAPSTYTRAQIASHNTSSSCWTSINGLVYDLTGWISQHPGGQAAILSICGKDGTQAFEAQHGNSRDTQPKATLATFKIGTLAS